MWDLTTSYINNAVDTVIKVLNETYRTIMAIPEPLQNFDNTLRVLSDTFGSSMTIINRITFLRYVHPDKDIRKASEKADIKIEHFFINLELRTDIFHFIVSIRDRFYGSLDSLDQRYIDFLIKSYERSGVHISDKKTIHHLKKIQQKISKLSIKFQSNISNADVTIQLTKDELSGLPEHFFHSIKSKVDKLYDAPLRTEIVNDILTYADKEETRKKVDRANKAKCMTNLDVLFELTNARREYAAILGYTSYAEYILETRMAGKQSVAVEFLDNLQRKLKEPLLKELATMKAEKKSTIFVWDKAYYEQKYKKERYGINEKMLENYFYMEHVLKVMFEKYQEIFDIKISVKLRSGRANLWHSDVKEYVVASAETDEIFGVFALDLFSRKHKADHFACFSITDRINREGRVVVPAYCVLMGNFRAPVGDVPALLQHGDLRTLYHEFGHVMHNMLGGSTHSLFSGTHVEWDFIEMPSQMLENLCWEFDNIKSLSEHWQTKAQLSDRDIEMIISSRGHNIALDYCIQIIYAQVDQRLHSGVAFDTVEQMIAAIDAIDKRLGMAGDNIGKISIFGHLATGYAASYYGYLWSEVYAYDIYAAIGNSPQQWKRYCALILSCGGSKDARDMLCDFLGRDPSVAAFNAAVGI